MLGALRDDALSATDDGFELRLSLPWIRSLPLASLVDVDVSIDDVAVDALRVRIGDRVMEPAELAGVSGWWFVQDRVVLVGRDGQLDPGAHEVSVSFGLVVPYLQVGPDGPLTLPFRFSRTLRLDAPNLSPVALDAA